MSVLDDFREAIAVALRVAESAGSSITKVVLGPDDRPDQAIIIVIGADKVRDILRAVEAVSGDWVLDEEDERLLAKIEAGEIPCKAVEELDGGGEAPDD